jgi:hypothetical protein
MVANKHVEEFKLVINGLKYLAVVVNAGVDALCYVTNVYAGGSQLVRVV